MSFYTTLHLYRPSPPPIVTGPALAEFLRRLAATGIAESLSGDILSVKFGRAIDRDMKGTFIEEPVPGVLRMFSVHSIEMDIEHSNITFDDALCLLSNHDRPIYRASVHFGTARPEIIAALQTQRPDDESVNLCLWDCTFHLGPVTIGSMSSEESFMVGWMTLSFSGNGYLFPWEPRDLTDRAAALPELQPAVQLCREVWPVDPENPGGTFGKLVPALRRRTISARRRMGDLWPHRELDRPWDWFWGVAESG